MSVASGQRARRNGWPWPVSFVSPFGARPRGDFLVALLALAFLPSLAGVGVGFGCGNRVGGALPIVDPGRPVGPDVRHRGGDVHAVVTSNILRRDYAGSAACTPCHADVVAAWSRSPMHRMTRLPESTDVRAPFDDREFRFKNDVARVRRVETAGGTERFIELLSAASPPGEAVATPPARHIYRVTKVIGGRVREDFAGVEVDAVAASARLVGDPQRELILPVSFVLATASFRLKGYSVMVGERPGLRAGGIWNQTCIFCHNTIPLFDDLWGALHGPGAPGYQGEVVDRALPLARQARYRVTSADELFRALDDEVTALGAPRGAVAASLSAAAALAGGEGGAAAERAALRRAILEAKGRFSPGRFVELGIGCEACHGGAREHVDDPRVHPTFAPRGRALTVELPADTSSVAARGRGIFAATAPAPEIAWQNRACARCHQVLFSRYPRTWEGGSRRDGTAAGGSHITSGEARDFLLGGCARAMACSTCHDPHGTDSPSRLAWLATPAGNGVCVRCHENEGATPATLRAHAHHDPQGAGGSCVACHMPRKNLGLGYALTRYHRIGSPTDVARVEGDRPLECALCHGDKTVGALLDDMGRLWGKRYAPASITRLYGSREANVLLATIERGAPHEQATAMASAGEQRLRQALPLIVRQAASHPFPLVRYFAAAASARLTGVPLSPEGWEEMTHLSSSAPAPASPAFSPHGREDPDSVDSD